MSNYDVVELMANAIDENQTALASEGVGVRVRITGTTSLASLWLDAESTRGLAHAVLYSTGDMTLIVADAASNAIVLDEHRSITSDVGVRDALETIRYHLGTL